MFNGMKSEAFLNQRINLFRRLAWCSLPCTSHSES